MHGWLGATLLGPRLLAVALCLSWLNAPGAARADAPVNAVFGLAIGGYDSVAYFRAGRARAGSARYPHLWNGVVWLFATPANRDAFAAEPERFAPRYGGFSAHGVANGAFYAIDPHAFLIADGRLYLHANHYVKRLWAADLTANIAKADARWRRMVGAVER